MLSMKFPTINLLELYENPDKFKDIIDLDGFLIYRIFNQYNGKSYIGSTTTGLRNRMFNSLFGHFHRYEEGDNHPLYVELNSLGLDKFSISILSFNESESEAYYIERYKASSEGYNLSLDGLGGGNNLGKVCISKGGNYTYVEPYELEKYLSLGYIIDTPLSGTIWVTKDNESKMINPNEVKDYLIQGYELGRGNFTNKGPQGKIRVVNKDEDRRFIEESEIIRYHNLGYAKGMKWKSAIMFDEHPDYKHLFDFPTIISNSCWGGMITKLYGVPYNSPFTGSFIVGEDYLKLLKDWDNFNFHRFGITSNLNSRYHNLPLENQELVYPVVKLYYGVEVHFPHYTLDDDMEDIWNRRLDRMDKNNLLFKFSKSRLATDEQLKEFCQLRLPGRKILITDDILKYIKYESSTLKVIQSRVSPGECWIDDEPLESLHNLNYDLYGYKFNKQQILKGLGWIK